MTATRTLTLVTPLELRSAKTGEVVTRIETLELRAPKLGDLVAAMDAAGAAREPGTMTLHLASRVTGVPVRDLSELSIDDGAALLEAVADFMPAGLKGGNGSSKPSPAASASPQTGGAGGQPS